MTKIVELPAADSAAKRHCQAFASHRLNPIDPCAPTSVVVRGAEDEPSRHWWRRRTRLLPVDEWLRRPDIKTAAGTGLEDGSVRKWDVTQKSSPSNLGAVRLRKTVVDRMLPSHADLWVDKKSLHSLWTSSLLNAVKIEVSNSYFDHVIKHYEFNFWASIWRGARNPVKLFRVPYTRIAIPPPHNNVRLENNKHIQTSASYITKTIILSLQSKRLSDACTLHSFYK